MAMDTLGRTLHLLERWLETPPGDLLKISEPAVWCFNEHFHIGTVAKDVVQIIRLPERTAAGSEVSSASIYH